MCYLDVGRVITELETIAGGKIKNRTKQNLVLFFILRRRCDNFGACRETYCRISEDVTNVTSQIGFIINMSRTKHMSNRGKREMN